MVVVLVISILLAIAVPTFLGARERANNRSAQSNLRNAMTVQFTYFSDDQRFTEDPVELNAIDPSLNFVNGPVTNLTATPRLVHVTVSSLAPAVSNVVVMGAKTPSGNCYWIRSVGGTDSPRFAEDNCSGASLVWLESWNT